MKIKRVFLIVLDSFGIGKAPDSELFGDKECNTLATIVKSKEYHTPNLKKLGLFNIDGVSCGEKEAHTIGSFGRLQESSIGKDTTTGHWEIAGIISKTPMPTYPNGFPDEIIEEFKKQTSRGVLLNKPYSGTDAIKEYGKQHVETGDLIVYTSADSVFQIAAHEEIVPLETLYEYCKIARKMLQGKHGVGRVIARPFEGEYPDYKRTSHRHDFSLQPTGKTMLDVLDEKGFATIGVGKIFDIFAGRSIQETTSIANNTDGMEKTIELLKNKDFKGLCFVNLVDFDMIYGHRNDIDGYAKAATDFDKQLGEFMQYMKDDDIVILTADHGCDPGAQGTDHTREYVPMLAYGKQIKENTSIGTCSTFADIAATILDIFKIEDTEVSGESFLKEILK